MEPLIIEFRGGTGDESAVIKLEGQLGCRLPEDYRSWILAHKETIFYLDVPFNPEYRDIDQDWDYTFEVDILLTIRELEAEHTGQNMRVPDYLLSIAQAEGGEVGINISQDDFGAIYASSYVYYDEHIKNWLDNPDFVYTKYYEENTAWATPWASVRIADSFTDWLTSNGQRELIEGDVEAWWRADMERREAAGELNYSGMSYMPLDEEGNVIDDGVLIQVDQDGNVIHNPELEEESRNSFNTMAAGIGVAWKPPQESDAELNEKDT